MSDKQKLVDIVFEVAYMVSRDARLKDDDTRNDWIRRQLKECGFDGKPIGISHYSLKEK